MCLEVGADLNVTTYDPDVNTLALPSKVAPLLIAVKKGVKVAKLLLDHHCEVDPVDEYGQTPLFKASERGDVEVCQLLLHHKANVNKKGFNDMTPLHVASNVKVAKLLLDHQCEVDPVDEDGETPLFKASKRGDVEMCQLLLHLSLIHI